MTNGNIETEKDWLEYLQFLCEVEHAVDNWPDEDKSFRSTNFSDDLL